jgi:hypothetical protein
MSVHIGTDCSHVGVDPACDVVDCPTIDKCEIAIGYWYGDYFHPVTLEPHLSGLTFKVRYWATLRDVPEDENMRQL